MIGNTPLMNRSLEGGGAQERLFQRRYLRPIFLAWAIAMFNQLSGINALMYYAPRIFEMTESTERVALLKTVAVGGTNLVFTLVGMSPTHWGAGAGSSGARLPPSPAS